MLRCAWHFVMVNMIVSFVCLIPLSVTSWARCSQVLLLAIAYSVVKWESFFYIYDVVKTRVSSEQQLSYTKH